MGTTKKCKWFKLYELLPPEIYDESIEDELWCLIDDNLKETIDYIREHIVKAPLVCNTWHSGGDRVASGYRDKNSPVGAKYSQHKEGRAADLICSKYTAEQMRQMILSSQYDLPHYIRMEDGVNWLHVDTKPRDYKGDKVYLFSA